MPHRRVLSTVLALAVGIPALAMAAPANAASAGAKPLPPEVRVGAKHLASARPAARLSGSRLTKARAGVNAPIGTRGAPAPRARLALATCDSIAAGVNQLRDRTVIFWQPQPRTAAVQIYRQRRLGALQLIASPATTASSYTDRSTSPDGAAAFRIDVTTDEATTSCTIGQDLTMNFDGGFGLPDVVISGADGLVQQNQFSLSTPLGSGPEDAPDYSPDGRWVAYTTFDLANNSSSVRVRRADGRAGGERVFTARADFQWNLASFSQDGRYLAWSEIDATDPANPVVSGMLYADLWRGTAPVYITTGATAFDPVWLPGNTTLVAAGAGATDGLVRINVSTGVSTAVTGTTSAYSPEVTPNGVILYSQFDATDSSSTLKRIEPSGAISRVIAGGPGETWSNARLAKSYLPGEPDVVFARQDVDPTPDQPGSGDETVSYLRIVGGVTDTTNIGFSSDGSFFSGGFDLRQPKTKGSADQNGDGFNDVVARDTSGQLWLYPNSQNPDAPFGARRQIGSGWNIYNAVVATGDFNGDQIGDLVTRDTAGVLWFYSGTRAGGVLPRRQIGSGWNGYTVMAAGDFDQDTRADLLARDGAGALWLYPGSGTGGALGSAFQTRRQVGSGWQIFTSIVGVGDATYDNVPDLVARDSAGTLYLYPGNGSGGFGARVKAGSGWNIFNGLAGPEMWAVNMTSLLARRTDGVMLEYDFIGDGSLSGDFVFQVGSGWNGYLFTS
ncbi:MAG TPA: FG-GAP-like repeat-containing protein [Dermatophilaceae bacterium]|nr:FG-GAP-like repeat-containing protein [Dermatophilaceae bacterium]